jgi:dipeptidyl aminopeptidase/acylaminoacyl peptidase
MGFMASPSSSAAGGGALADVLQVNSSTSLVWFGVDGVQGETLPLPAGQFAEVRLSPEGTRVATSRNDRDNPLSAGADVWLIDLARKSGSRVTFDPQFEFAPAWSPNGRAIYFNSNKTGEYLIYRKSAEVAGEAVAITPDGKMIVFEATGALSEHDGQRAGCSTLSRWPLDRLRVRRIREVRALRAVLPDSGKQSAGFK